MPLSKVNLGGGLELANLGYGVMGLCWGYSASAYADAADPAAEARKKSAACFEELMKHTNGIPIGISTANIYSTPGLPSGDELIGDAIKAHGRDKIVVLAKLGVDFAMKPMQEAQREEHLTKQLEKSLAQLGTDFIDVLVLNRPAPHIPIEDTMKVIKGFVAAGKVKHVGLAEATPDEIRRAHAVHPIAFIEQEFSLHTRQAVIDHLFPVLKELGIGLVAYSPLSRGLLSGVNKADLKAGDYRLTSPRFSDENVGKNASAAEKLAAIAERKGCKPTQLALAYLMAKAKLHGVTCVPIPGSTNPARVAENLGGADVSLSAEDVAEIEAAIPEAEGDRYAGMHATFESKLKPAAH
jgi:aryl-alcohol dehydrogenase-like predicted oxidoreductase